MSSFKTLTIGTKNKLILLIHLRYLRCEDIILGCTHDVTSYSSIQCCREIFGSRTYVTDLATMCVSTAKQPPLEEIFASQIYGLTVYLKTNTRDRFGNLVNVFKNKSGYPIYDDADSLQYRI